MTGNYAGTSNKMDRSKIGDSSPIISFGVISDVQYGDMDNAKNFRGTRCRYYRNSLNQLQKAVEHWNSSLSPVSFVLQLGDIIDGFNARFHKSEEALNTVLGVVNTCSAPFHHIWGNHEFYNFKRTFLLESPLNSNPNPTQPADETHYYYDFSPVKGLRFVMLDVYEVSLLGYTHDHPRFEEAQELLKQHNPNQDLNSKDGLFGLEERYRQFNGGVSDEQLTWLNSVLKKAKANSENVIIAGHVPLHEASSTSDSLLWNYDQVLDIMYSHTGTVVAYFCGHDHNGGYALDDHGIHHMTMPGVVETDPDSSAFATAHVHKHGILMEGRGSVRDLMIPFNTRLEYGLLC